MPQNHAKHHLEQERVKLIGIPKEMINLMIPGGNEIDWATDQIENEGPKHKQIFSALLLQRLYKLIRATEKSTGKKFELQQGYELFKDNGEEESAMPLEIPINMGTGLEKKQIADAVSRAPEHEILIYGMCLQTIEWVIKVTENK